MTREEAIKYIKLHCIPNYPKTDNTQWDEAMSKAIQALQEQKVGKWISHIEHGIHGDIQCWVCSECRELFSYDAETGVEITNYHICPNCGAEMKGCADMKINRMNCEYRHDNGNCLKVGGFCTSVDDKHCLKAESEEGAEE